MAKNKLVYFAVPCFNQKNQVDKFLGSVLKQNYQNYKVVIVDDGSSDGTAEMVKTKYPDVILLKGDGNLWWSGSTNLAVKRAVKDGADFVLTVNSDVKLGPNYLKNILDSAAIHPKSLIGSMVCYEDDTNKVWFFGGYYDKELGQMSHRHGEVSDYSQDMGAEWLTGMGVLVPISAYKAAGLYDEYNFPQYFGDSDFSMRAKGAGYSLWVSYNARVVADVGSSWFTKWNNDPKLRYFYDLFFSLRSPYQLPSNYRYYKKHWPEHWRRALLKAYTVRYLHIYKRLAKNYVRKLIK